MSATGLPVFDEAVQVADAWLDDLAARLGSDNRRYAYQALRAVLHALRDNLEPDAAVRLGAQVPMLVRGFYYENWRPGRTPARERRIEDFLDHVRHGFHGFGEIDAGWIAHAVFVLLASRLSPGEVRKVVRVLPPEIREIWPLLD